MDAAASMMMVVMLMDRRDLVSWLAQLGINFTINDLLQEGPGSPVVVIGLFLLLELAFWFYCRYYLHPRLNKLQAPQPNHRGAKAAITSILSMTNKIKDHYAFDVFLAKWFRGTRVDEIRKGNVAEYFCWVIFNKHAREATNDELDLVNWAVSEYIDISA